MWNEKKIATISFGIVILVCCLIAAVLAIKGIPYWWGFLILAALFSFMILSVITDGETHD